LPDRFLVVPKPAPAPEHVTVYLAVDLSGSMSGEPLVAAKKAAHEFMSKVDLAHMSVGVIAVADSTAVKLKAGQNARDVARAIESLTIGEVGIGNAAHPFDEAYGLLQGNKGSRYLLVLADGVWSDQRLAVERAQRCHRDGIDVIAIGFGGADESFLRAVASSEEGSIFTNLGGLSETFGSIAQVLTESGSGDRRATLGRLRGR
jgi:Mg-chelatase subunit ChlD